MAKTGNQCDKSADKRTSGDKGVQNIHKGHRSRMRERFMRDNSLDNFEYHEIVELILYYSIKQSNTNPLAHRLLNTYGSLHALLEAKPEDIMKRCGVSENTAVLLSLIKHIAKRCNDSLEVDSVFVKSKRDAFKVLKTVFADDRREGFWLVCLDVSHRVMCVSKTSEGTKDSAVVYVDRIVEKVTEAKAAYAIIAHNHPSGVMRPSCDDIDSTVKIVKAIATVNVVLLDHIIFCNNNCYSFAQHGLCNLKY
jgi:DNA repair protein RadC